MLSSNKLINFPGSNKYFSKWKSEFCKEINENIKIQWKTCRNLVWKNVEKKGGSEYFVYFLQYLQDLRFHFRKINFHSPLSFSQLLLLIFH